MGERCEMMWWCEMMRVLNFWIWKLKIYENLNENLFDLFVENVEKWIKFESFRVLCVSSVVECVPVWIEFEFYWFYEFWFKKWFNRSCESYRLKNELNTILRQSKKSEYHKIDTTHTLLSMQRFLIRLTSRKEYESW